MHSRFTPGTTIVGRFRLEQPLGEGAYGEVWRAVQLPVDRPVAIKLLKPSSDHFAKQRFDREARAMASISHPNCVTLFDFGHLPGDAGSYLATELVAGETVWAWMQRQPPLADVVSVCQQVISALAAAHQRQVLHRDLKPENIMITHDHQRGTVVKVLDFGLSKIVDDERRDITKTGEIFGTPGYMSPEQLRGQEIGPATDLYSFGVIFYQLLEGRPPFTAQSAHEISLMHLTHPVPPITADVPAPLANLAMRLLTKDPRSRPETAEVLRVLGAVAATDPTQGPQKTPSAATTNPRPPTIREAPKEQPEPARSPARVPPHVFVVSGLVALLAVVAVMIALGKDEVTNDEPPTQPSPPPSPSVVAPEPVADEPETTPTPTKECLLAPGTSRVEQRRGLTTSWALLHVPESAMRRGPTPLVVLLHEAAAQDPTWMTERTKFVPHAEENGAILLIPNGGDPPFQSLDEWEEVWGWITHVREEHCVPPGPVFLFGYGAGGLAAENMPAVFEGITATVTASHRLGVSENVLKADKPVPHLAIFPLKDPWDPVKGGTCSLGTVPKSPLASHVAALRERHGCSGDDVVEKLAAHRCTSWTCETPLRICEIEAGRPWPGLERRIDPCAGGQSATDFPYDDVVWQFWAEHGLQPAETAPD